MGTGSCASPRLQVSRPHGDRREEPGPGALVAPWFVAVTAAGKVPRVQRAPWDRAPELLGVPRYGRR